MGIILALLLFSFIVFFHELGHFLLARKNGIYVEEFCIGMGPVLVKKKGKETTYSIRLLPIGGACMMGEDEVDDLSEGSFNSKSVWARISVIAAGPIFNFILAFILSVIVVSWLGYDKPVINTVLENSAAEEAGLQQGDVIKEINNKNIHIFREISAYNQFHPGEKMELKYERNGKDYKVALTPRKSDSGGYLIGITQKEYQKANAFTALQYGAYEVKFWIDYTIESLKMLFTGVVGLDQLSGPVGIVDVVDQAYDTNIQYGVSSVVLAFLNLSILLSANLGVMNLLPIPALDGGRLVFLFVEAIRGKRVPPEKEGMVHFIGLIALFGLMIFVMYNDLQRLF